jgi:hypothetical protein
VAEIRETGSGAERTGERQETGQENTESKMMRRFCFAIVLALLTCSVLLHAAGTATTTITDLGGGYTKVSIAWTSTAGGAVSANPFTPRRGHLMQVQFIPGGGGTQPTNAYDITLVDATSVDWLNIGGLSSVGTDLSNATSTIKSWNPQPWVDGTMTLDLVVANAGASKTGTVVIWIAP